MTWCPPAAAQAPSPRLRRQTVDHEARHRRGPLPLPRGSISSASCAKQPRLQAHPATRGARRTPAISSMIRWLAEGSRRAVSHPGPHATLRLLALFWLHRHPLSSHLPFGQQHRALARAASWYASGVAVPDGGAGVAKLVDAVRSQRTGQKPVRVCLRAGGACHASQRVPPPAP